MNVESINRKVKNHSPSILGLSDFAKFAVFLPLIQKEDGLHILFEIRSHRLRRQPGEICFPGGRIDKEDKTDQMAAIRETQEELGILREQISDVSPLDYFVSPFGMIIYPHVGFIEDDHLIDPNPDEVTEVFTVPLSFFLNTKPRIHYVNARIEPEADFPFELIAGGEDYNWRTNKIDEYFYIYEDKVIWGLTAKILAHFIEMIR